MKRRWNKRLISFVFVFIVIISFFPVTAGALTLTYVDRGISAPRHGAYAGLYNLTMDGDPVMGMCDDYTTHMGSTWEASLYTYEDINDGTQKGKFNNGGVDYKLYNKVAYAFSQTFGETDPNRLADINAVVWKIMYQALDISGWSTYASNLYAAANMHDDYNWSGKMYVLTPDPLNASQEILVQAPVPEPATLFLLGTGLIGLAGFGRRKFKK